MEKRLIGYRRNLFRQLNIPVRLPTPFKPTKQPDEIVGGEIRHQFRQAEKLHRLQEDKQNIASKQRDSGAKIARSITQPYILQITAGIIGVPILLVPQNLNRIFLSFIYCPGAQAAGSITFSLNNPNNPGGLSPRIGYSLTATNLEKTFNSSVCPCDPIYITAGANNTGSIAVVYEGVSVGDLEIT